MADGADKLIETPETCEETTEYDNRIEDDFEIEPEGKLDEIDSREKWEEIELKFARFERNYRARRIRELTLAPLIVKRRGRGRPRKRVLA